MQIIFKHKNNPRLEIVVTKSSDGKITAINSHVRFPFYVGQLMQKNVEIWACNNNFLMNGEDTCPENKIFGVKVSDIPKGHPLRYIYPNKFKEGGSVNLTMNDALNYLKSLKNDNAGFMIDELAKELTAKEKLGAVEINKRKAEIPKDALKKRDLEKAIKYEVKEAMILEQEESGIREKIIAWAKAPENNVKILSGGKDSIAMVLHLLESGFDKKNIELHHHDVDGHGEDLYDWKCTVSYCKAFAKAFDLPIYFSYRKGGILRSIYRENEVAESIYYQAEVDGNFIELKSMAMSLKDATGHVYTAQELYDKNTRRMFPAVSANLATRWCSQAVKIDVMSRVVTAHYTEGNYIILTGERRAESTSRSMYLEFEHYGSKKRGGERTVFTWRPVIDWTTREVWDILKKYKVQPHPCYELGFSRCSCQLCIFLQRDSWATVNEIAPNKVARIAEIEGDIGHTLYNKKDKDGKMQNIYESMVLQGKSYLTDENKKRWLVEAMGEFVSPIIVKEWKEPQGAFSIRNEGAN